MRTTGAAIAAGIVYLIAPDVLNRAETVLFLLFVFGTSWAVIQWMDDVMTDIRRKRETLRIRQPRKAMKVDYRISRRLEIPAFRVED